MNMLAFFYTVACLLLALAIMSTAVEPIPPEGEAR
jgi:hypothetical protein